MRRRTSLLPAAAAAALVLAACTEVPAEIKEAAAVECPEGSACYDPPRPAGPGGQLTIEGGEWYLEVTEGQAFEGQIEVTFVNAGGSEHNVTVDESYGEGDTIPPSNIPGGESATGTWELFPGEYIMYCSVPGHREQGMEAMLTVASSGQAGVAPTGGLETTAPPTEAATPGEGGPSPIQSGGPGQEAGPQGPPPVPRETES